MNLPVEGRGFQIIAPPVTSKWAKGSGGPAGDECQNIVAQPLTTRPYADSVGHQEYCNYVNERASEAIAAAEAAEGRLKAETVRRQLQDYVNKFHVPKRAK